MMTILIHQLLKQQVAQRLALLSWNHCWISLNQDPCRELCQIDQALSNHSHSLRRLRYDSALQV